MRRFALILLFATPAAADCLPGGEVFSCQVGAKVLEICNESETLIYAFGPPGAPELVIAEPLSSVTYTPWPGVSSSIWDTVAFFNEGYTYEVVTSVDRNGNEDAPLEGDVYVLQGEELVAEVNCDPGTASNSLDVVWDLKESIGQCWDFDAQSWQTSCTN